MKVEIFLLALFCLFVSGCGGTTTGNPLVNISFSSYSESASNKVSAQAVSSVVMCFKRLRFKKVDEAVSEGNIDLALGEIILTPIGQELTTVVLAKGEYDRVEFDLEKDCMSGKSLEVSNDHGTFSTDSTITIRFEGQFTVDQKQEHLPLQIQTIISALGDVTADGEVKTKAEGVSGSF